MPTLRTFLGLGDGQVCDSKKLKTGPTWNPTTKNDGKVISETIGKAIVQ